MEFDETGVIVSIGTKGRWMLNRILATEATGLPVQATYY